MEDPHMLRRHAYIDGQLPAPDRRRYEAFLKAAKKHDAREEYEFQRDVERRLGGGKGCPDDVWLRLRERIEHDEKPRPRVWIEWRGLKPLAIAAAVVANVILALALAEYVVRDPQPPILDTALQPGRAAFTVAGRFPGDWARACQCLRHHGFDINLADEECCRALGVELLGVRYQYLDGQRVAQVMLRQGDRLAMVFIGNRAAIGMENLPEAELGGGLVAACREIGDYRLIALAEDRPQALLDLFS